MTGSNFSGKKGVQPNEMLKDVSTYISQFLSSKTGNDFCSLFSDYSDEMNGFLDLLPDLISKWKEFKMSKLEISTFLTLKLISGLSLWFGHAEGFRHAILDHRAKFDDKSRDLQHISRKHKSPDLNAGIVVPVHISNPDESSVKSISSLIESVHSWHNLSKIWVVGAVPSDVERLWNKNQKVEVVKIDDDRGPAKARNAGIEKSLENDLNLTVFVDDDVIAPSFSVLDRIGMQAVNRKEIVSPKFISTGNTCFDVYHDLDGTLNGVYLSNEPSKGLMYATTCLLSVPNNILKEGLRFDESFPIAAGEDVDFSLKAREAGYKITASDESVVLHNYGYERQESSLLKFSARYTRYGQGNQIVLGKYPDFYESLMPTLYRPSTTLVKKNFTIPEELMPVILKLQRYLN